VDARQIRGLSRSESDAAAALGAFLVVALVLLSTIVLGLHVLSGLPPIMVYGIFFGVLVFTIVCGAAFMKSDISAKHHGPPQLQFRAPVRRAKKRKPKSPAL
jgi:uncharacterized membrane protein